jgi:hypothetical protein
MTWQEKLIQLNQGNPITLFSTATTGLRPGNSSLLAVSYAKVTANAAEPIESGRLLKSIPDVNALEGQEYHKFSPSFVQERGLPEDLFRQELRQKLSGCCFSYNPRFQVGFLEQEIGDDTPFVHDLLLMLKGAEMKLCLDVKVFKDMHTVENFFINRLGKAPGLKSMCIGRDLEYEPPLSTFPVDYFTSCLFSFWKMLANLEVTIQEDLF